MDVTNLTPNEISIALRHYVSQRKAWRTYNEKKKQEKIDNGTYKPKGRPKKEKVEMSEK